MRTTRHIVQILETVIKGREQLIEEQVKHLALLKKSPLLVGMF